ncbi:MAG: UbiX family flavin prenyltransferase [Blastocatellia bacterium]|nr:UbiX family flavin prenyltransferase [Blastocatellia bacterium]MCS7156435.1 UbiX family flavin prenyltransferase [Blastocatellia bacterium]MCX7751824.1 UbiX family flavin prenyltransferase [Blastocatellia bacterium]MDW8168926.1 flavin prenyltransferase UbiX [Acidobacteriota bacterium]MDW8256686.1 flavin prenyltransferase UbiX [Acidobacteriota bacterium]
MSEGVSITVAITGASGACYAQRLLQLLDASPHVRQINLLISDNGRRVFAEELDVEIPVPLSVEVADRLGLSRHKLVCFQLNDLAAPISSGSYPVNGMVIIPCSVGTLGAIATGATTNLIHRAADVMLKEGRRLILVVRETPLNAIHLQNMLTLRQLGAVILPAMPAFYHRPRTIDDLVKHFVYRILDHLGIEHSQETMWRGGRT